MEKFQYAVQELRHMLRIEAAREDLPYIDAVKESTITTPMAPRLIVSTLFNSHVLDPRHRAGEVEWLEFFGNGERASQ